MKEFKFRAWDRNERDSFRMKRHLSLNSAYFSQESLNGIVVMQFTGLFDKNDQPIYEGDLLRRRDGGVDEVFYRNDQGQFMVMQRSPEEICDDVLWRFADDSEVIGNIYENPELLAGLH